MHCHKFVLKRIKVFVEMSFLISDRTNTLFDAFHCKTFLRSLKSFTIKVSFEAKKKKTSRKFLWKTKQIFLIWWFDGKLPAAIENITFPIQLAFKLEIEEKNYSLLKTSKKMYKNRVCRNCERFEKLNPGKCSKHLMLKLITGLEFSWCFFAEFKGFFPQVSLKLETWINLVNIQQVINCTQV